MNNPTLAQALLKFYREKKVDPDYLANLPQELRDKLYDDKYIALSITSDMRLSSIGIATAQEIMVGRYFMAEKLLERCQSVLEDSDHGFLYSEIRLFLES